MSAAQQVGIRQLRYFVAVMQHGSFRAAADAVHISQPPLTRQVQQLEEVIGVRLLERGARGVTATPAGQAFFEDATNILQLIDSAATRARRTGMGQLGRLDVGVFGSTVLNTIPRIMKAFRELYPEVEVVLHNMDRETQVRALRDRRIAIGINRFFDDEPGLHCEALYSERLFAVFPANHRLAERHTMRFRDLANEPLIMYPRVSRPTGFTYELMKIFHDRGINPNIVQQVDGVVTAVALVSSGIGTSFAVDSARTLQLPGIRYVPFDPTENVRFELSIIWREEDDSALTRSFLQVARDCDKGILEPT
ncbi:MAG: LysR family transcriptional regulator [Erythrobacteraceae bacterium]|nr:LysR family transcriptional regulator [Erythrobacteraceae bacterium]